MTVRELVYRLQTVGAPALDSEVVVLLPQNLVGESAAGKYRAASVEGQHWFGSPSGVHESPGLSPGPASAKYLLLRLGPKFLPPTHCEFCERRPTTIFERGVYARHACDEHVAKVRRLTHLDLGVELDPVRLDEP